MYAAPLAASSVAVLAPHASLPQPGWHVRRLNTPTAVERSQGGGQRGADANDRPLLQSYRRRLSTAHADKFTQVASRPSSNHGALIRWYLDEAARALVAERDENTCRKDLLPSEAVALARDLEPLEREAARARQATAGPAEGRGKKTGGAKLAQPVGRARDKIAAAVGVDRKTLDKAEAVPF